MLSMHFSSILTPVLPAVSWQNKQNKQNKQALWNCIQTCFVLHPGASSIKEDEEGAKYFMFPTTSTEVDRNAKETHSSICWQHCLIAKWCLASVVQKLHQSLLGTFDATHTHLTEKCKPWHSHLNVCLMIHTLYSLPSVSFFPHLPHKTEACSLQPLYLLFHTSHLATFY